MVLEEHQRNSSSNNSSSSSRSKSKKAKKIPQRGLGVAQLEKLRIDELKKKTSASPSSSSLPSFKIPQSPPKQQPLMAPSLDTHPLSGLANIESSASSIRGFISSLEFDGNSTRSTLERNNQIDPSGARAPLPSNTSSSNIWRHGPFQRSQFYPHQMQSLHNPALPSSSGVNIQIEPPSNQIYSSTFVKPYGWPEEERNQDSNSQWPLHPYPLTAFTTTLPLARKSPFFFPSDPRNTDFREDVLSSGTHLMDLRNSDSHISKRLRESSTSTTDDGFLTLSSSMSRPILPDQHFDADLLLSRSNGGINHGLPRCVDDLLPPPFYNFMPPAPANTSESNSKDGSGEASNGVDTDLKLG